MSKPIVKTLKIIGNVIMWLFVAFAIVITVLVLSAQNKEGLPNVGGKSLVNVLTDSMYPTFKSGDLIVDDLLTDDEKKNCKVGEIITYYTDLNGDGNDEINTHRIIESYEDGGYTYYKTQGDNKETNKVADKDPVDSYKVIGKYTGTRFGFAGTVVGFLQTSTGFLCVIVIPLVVFFLFEFYNFISTIVKIKGKVSVETEEEIKRRAVEEYINKQNVDKAEDKDGETADK